MALRDFQQVLSGMTLDVRFASAVRKDGALALTGYDLTSLEQERLVDVARQPGMDLNCALSRGNRFAPIIEMFPLTCELLKPDLRELLDELWNCHRPDNYQLQGEEDAFAGLLAEKIARGEMQNPYAGEVFQYESACLELARSLRYTPVEELMDQATGSFRLTHFQHDPQILLSALEKREVPPDGIQAGDYAVRITLQGDALVAELV